MNATTRPTEGWDRVSGAAKRHYFLADRRSLCGRWACLGGFDPDPAPGPNDCAPCAARAVKRAARAEKNEAAGAIGKSVRPRPWTAEERSYRDGIAQRTSGYDRNRKLGGARRG